MTNFADVLGPLSARLPLPQPARSRVLLEVAADLEAAYEHYRAEGCSEEEARRRAAEAFDLSDTALAELVALHTSFARRMLDRLSSQARTRWERSLLLIVAGFLTYLGVELAVRGGIITDAGSFVWPVLICGAAGLLLGIAKLYQVYVKQDHEVRRARRGLDAIAVLAGAQLLLGFFGAWFELYLAAARISRSVDYALVHLFNWLLGSAALLSVSLTGALLTAMLWFAVASRVAGIEDAEAELLLAAKGE